MRSTSARYGTRGPTPLPGNDDLRRVERAYLDSGGEFLVIDLGTSEESEVVATGGYRPEPVEEGRGTETVELFRMAVAPEHRGEGYGGCVLSELERRASASGFERVVLTTAARQGSAGFYAAHGHRETGRTTTSTNSSGSRNRSTIETLANGC